MSWCHRVTLEKPGCLVIAIVVTLGQQHLTVAKELTQNRFDLICHTPLTKGTVSRVFATVAWRFRRPLRSHLMETEGIVNINLIFHRANFMARCSAAMPSSYSARWGNRPGTTTKP